VDDDRQKLLMEAAELERRLAEIRGRLASTKTQTGLRRSERPLRDVLLDLLADAGAPLNSTLVSSVFHVLFDRDVPPTRFGTLSTDEQKSFDSTRVRPVYLCHCLNYDDGQAVKRFWARSDWPLQDRIVGPMSGRALFLKGAAWVIKLARDYPTPAHRTKLEYLAADQARSAGLPFRRGEFPYSDWLSGVDALLERHVAEDEVSRVEAAERLVARLPARDLLFGTKSGMVSLPGSTSRWRSANE
jgi:hypothetical protein